MGGKRLKFPKRKKFVPGQNSPEGEVEEKPVSEEEHRKRIELLKSLGLVKPSSDTNSEENKEAR